MVQLSTHDQSLPKKGAPMDVPIANERGRNRGVQNRLLRMLTDQDWEMLAPRLQAVTLKSRQVLHHANTRMEHAYFIEQGLVSVWARDTSTKWVAGWLIGSEGLAGVPVVLGHAHASFRRIVSVPGQALRISTKDLSKAIRDSSSLQRLLLHYSGTVLIQATQSGICNAQHGLKQRLARWLLLASDALEDANLPVTQLALSKLLGVRRPSVTSCLGVLRDDGLIEITRGLLKIQDVEGLSATACVCHHVIKNAYVRLVHDNHAGSMPIKVYGLEHVSGDRETDITSRPEA